MNKSLITTVVSTSFVGAGLVIDSPFNEPILSAGLFALAGSVTNWLAIHMLFEKVPGLYGSGIITLQFEQFKQGIHHLIMEQFFNRDNVARFIADIASKKETQHIDFSGVINATDFSPAFDSLVATIMESSFGSMLDMFGGVTALTPLKAPFIDKMKSALTDMTQTDSFQQTVKSNLANVASNDDFFNQIEVVVSRRLDELTPVMVKNIIQEMIRQHLGWLVVWGGVFGGLIGLIASLFNL